MAKSFFEMAQQAARHRASKVLTEMGVNPGGGNNNAVASPGQPTVAAANPATTQKGTAPTESPDVAIDAFATAWPTLTKDYVGAIDALVKNPQTKQLGATLQGLQKALQTASAAMKQQAAKTPAPVAGNNPQAAPAAGTQQMAKAPGVV